MSYSKRVINIFLSCGLFILLYCPQISNAQKIDTLLVWPNGAPGALGNSEDDKPSLIYFIPEKNMATGAAVLICPGGGYVALAAEHEGRRIARWYNSMGIAAFVLKYRRNTWDYQKYGYPAAFDDATRAMRIIRSRAKEWNINPSKVGIMGFSAGGHLASTVGTHFDKGNAKAKNKIDQMSSRPDFMILGYPVISFTTRYSSRFSRSMALGPNPTKELAEYLSNERQVTPQTPSTFLVHSNDDEAVLAENSVLFYGALREAGVPCEMHIFEHGGHGYGLATDDPILSSWADMLKNWLKQRGYVK